MVRLVLLSIVVYLVWQGLEHLTASRDSQAGGSKAGPEPLRPDSSRSKPAAATRLVACSLCGVHFDPTASAAVEPPVCSSCRKVRRLA